MNIKEILNTLKKNKLIFIILPWFIYALYLVLIAAPQYESTSKLIIKSTDGGSTFDPTSLLGGAVAGVTGSNDSQIIESYINSNDMMWYLEDTLNISEHYSADLGDMFSRLSDNKTKLEFYDYYLDHVTVEIDSASQVISLSVRAFTPTDEQDNHGTRGKLPE